VNLFDDLADLRSVLGSVAASDAALTTFEGAAELAIEAVAGPLGRRAVAVALIKADLTAQPGVLGLTEGNFTIQYANGQTYSVTRADVLESVGPLWSFG
jgi:hypothetical protein